MTSAFQRKQLCASVARLERSSALKEKKLFDRSEISSLQGVSDSFGLEGVNVWGCTRTVG